MMVAFLACDTSCTIHVLFHHDLEKKASTARLRLGSAIARCLAFACMLFASKSPLSHPLLTRFLCHPFKSPSPSNMMGEGHPSRSHKSWRYFITMFDPSASGPSQ